MYRECFLFCMELCSRFRFQICPTQMLLFIQRNIEIFSKCVQTLVQMLLSLFDFLISQMEKENTKQTTLCAYCRSFDLRHLFFSSEHLHGKFELSQDNKVQCISSFTHGTALSVRPVVYVAILRIPLQPTYYAKPQMKSANVVVQIIKQIIVEDSESKVFLFPITLTMCIRNF